MKYYGYNHTYTPATRDIKRGGVYYVDMDKKRPAIVISNVGMNRSSDNITVISVSSHLKRLDMTAHGLLSKPLNGRNAMYMAEHIYTVTRDRIGDYIDTLGKEDMYNIEHSLFNVLGF